MQMIALIYVLTLLHTGSTLIFTCIPLYVLPYLILCHESSQDMRTGRVITIHDNRSRLEAEMSAGDSQEGKNAIQALLGSFGKAASGSK